MQCCLGVSDFVDTTITSSSLLKNITMSRRLVLYASALLLLEIITIVTAIECYQCTSTTSTKHPFQCNEWLSDYNLKPISCDDVYGAKYCVKHIGRFEGGIGAKRYCSSLDLGNYCNYVKQPGDILEYRTCIFTCGTDGCNSGQNLRISFLCYVISLIFLITLM